MRTILEDHGYDLITIGTPDGRPTYSVDDWRRDLRRRALIRLIAEGVAAAFLVFVIVVAALILQ